MQVSNSLSVTSTIDVSRGLPSTSGPLSVRFVLPPGGPALWLTCYTLFTGSDFYIVGMKHGHPWSDASLSKLLDVVEERLDNIAETPRYDTSTAPSKSWL
jgi:hypothetical protein